MYHCIGIQVVNALLRHVDLVMADRGTGGKDLAVQVREADLVVVYEIELAYAHASQGLDNAAAHAADAKYGHPAPVQNINGGLAHDQGCPGILVQHKLLLGGQEPPEKSSVCRSGSGFAGVRNHLIQSWCGFRGFSGRGSGTAVDNSCQPRRQWV